MYVMNFRLSREVEHSDFFLNHLTIPSLSVDKNFDDLNEAAKTTRHEMKSIN